LRSNPPDERHPTSLEHPWLVRESHRLPHHQPRSQPRPRRSTDDVSQVRSLGVYWHCMNLWRTCVSLAALVSVDLLASVAAILHAGFTILNFALPDSRHLK